MTTEITAPAKPVVPKDWFLVPRFITDEAVEEAIGGSIVSYSYSHHQAERAERETE